MPGVLESVDESSNMVASSSTPRQTTTNEQPEDVEQTHTNLSRVALHLHNFRMGVRYGLGHRFRSGSSSSLDATAGTSTRCNSSSPEPPSIEGDVNGHPNGIEESSNNSPHHCEEPGTHGLTQRIAREDTSLGDGTQLESGGGLTNDGQPTHRQSSSPEC